MKCGECNKKLKEGDRVISVLQLIVNEKRGDFVSGPMGYVHLACIRKEDR